MGINMRKQIVLEEKAVMLCQKCNKEFPAGYNFCSACGEKLKKSSTKVLANMSQNGLTSISVKTPQGTINSKGKVTIPIGKGISYTQKMPKKGK